MPKPRRLPRHLAVVALGAGLALAPAGSARAASPGGQEPDLPAGPGTALPASGRVLVLRPHLLELVLDGRVVRSVAVRGPVDLGDLPWLAGDADYAEPLDDGSVGVRLGAVLVQRAGTAVAGTGLRLELTDTGGAGPARLTGSGARLSLRRAVVVADAAAGARASAAAGVRYLHGSDVTLEDVTLGGRGVEVRDPARLVVAGLDGEQVRGALLDVSAGTGARLGGVGSSGATGPVRVEGTSPARGAGRSWWDRPVQGAGAAAVVALVAGLGLEVLRGRSRAYAGTGERTGTGPEGGPEGGPGGAPDGELALDLGEHRVH